MSFEAQFDPQVWICQLLCARSRMIDLIFEAGILSEPEIIAYYLKTRRLG